MSNKQWLWLLLGGAAVWYWWNYLRVAPGTVVPVAVPSPVPALPPGAPTVGAPTNWSAQPGLNWFLNPANLPPTPTCPPGQVWYPPTYMAPAGTPGAALSPAGTAVTPGHCEMQLIVQ
jgi:hypothetical protein